MFSPTRNRYTRIAVLASILLALPACSDLSATAPEDPCVEMNVQYWDLRNVAWTFDPASDEYREAVGEVGEFVEYMAEAGCEIQYPDPDPETS